MKRTLIAAAALATLSGPVVAQGMGKDQLANYLGVDASQYSLAQLVQLKNAATESGNEGIVNIDGMRVNAENWAK